MLDCRGGSQLRLGFSRLRGPDISGCGDLHLYCGKQKEKLGLRPERCHLTPCAGLGTHGHARSKNEAGLPGGGGSELGKDLVH